MSPKRTKLEVSPRGQSLKCPPKRTKLEVSPEGTKLIAVGNAHGSRVQTVSTLKGSNLIRNSRPTTFRSSAREFFDPFRVGFKSQPPLRGRCPRLLTSSPAGTTLSEPDLNQVSIIKFPNGSTSHLTPAGTSVVAEYSFTIQGALSFIPACNCPRS